MSEWQDIETAPKDRPILVIAGNEHGFDVPMVGEFKDGTWGSYDSDYVAIDPTHWMPLPEPPAR